LSEHDEILIHVDDGVHDRLGVVLTDGDQVAQTAVRRDVRNHRAEVLCESL
jgi:hypothetical protein